jgi:chromosome segregation ATPase
MNPLNHNTNNAFTAVENMEAQIRANVLDTTGAAQEARAYTAPAAVQEPAQVLRGGAHSAVGDLHGFIGSALSTGANLSKHEVAEAAAEGQGLRGQLAQVEVEIKQVLQEIEAVRTEEQDAREGAADNQDRATTITENLNKAADAYRDLLGATSILD